MEIISTLIVGLASYTLGRVLAKFFFGFIFDWLAERNIHVAMAYSVLLLLLMIGTLVYILIRLF